MSDLKVWRIDPATGQPGQVPVINPAGTSVEWEDVSAIPTSAKPGHDIADEGAVLPYRSILNFVGPGVEVSDDSVGGRTIVTILATGSGGGGGGSADLERTDYVATAGQTVFTLPTDDEIAQIYVNGDLLAEADYTQSGTTLTLDTGLAAGDDLVVFQNVVAPADATVGGKRYIYRNSTQDSSGTVPSVDTQVAGMIITIPSAEVTRVAFVGFNILFTGAHTNRFSIYLDGTKVWPAANNANASNHGGNTTYELDITGVPLVLAADVGHTIELKWNASDSTAAVTFNERLLYADVYDGDGTSPVPIANGPQGARGPLPFQSPPVAWAMFTAYFTGPPASAVIYDGETYVAIANHTSTGSFDPTKWVKIAQKGLSGNDTGLNHIVGVGIPKMMLSSTFPPIEPAGTMLVLFG